MSEKEGGEKRRAEKGERETKKEEYGGVKKIELNSTVIHS